MSDQKYIVLYSDDKYKFDEYIIKLIKEKYNIEISVIHLLSLKDEKKEINNEKINQVYYDKFYEENVIKSCLFVVYLSSLKKTEYLCELLNKYNKYVFSNIILEEKSDEARADEASADEESYDEGKVEEEIEIVNKNVPIEYIYIYIEKVIKSIRSMPSFDTEQILSSSFSLQVEYKKEDNKTFKEYIQDRMNKNREIFIENYKKLEFEDKETFYSENKNQNIILQNVKKNNEVSDNKIQIITFYKQSSINILNIIQKKSIIENLKNSYVSKVLVLGNNLNEEFKDLKENKNLVLYEYNKNVSFKDLIDIANNVYNNKIVCILRSDIILLNTGELNDIKIDLHDKNQVYCLSRIERLISGDLTRCGKLNKIFYSTEQDAWLFKSPLNIQTDKLAEIYLYDGLSHLYLNKTLIDNGYNISNNSKKYKIIRILYENNLESRPLLNFDVSITNSDNIYLLPDSDSIDSISVENIIKLANIDNEELYKLKCDIFDKYIKKRIFN
jgi:hypothetical protein